MWSQINVVSNECSLKWMWSQMNVVSNKCGLKWLWSQMSVVSNECGLKWKSLKWVWSQMTVVSNDWCQMNVVSNEKVSNECDLKWTGLKWTWSQMKWSQMNRSQMNVVSNVVVSNKLGLRWMVSNELVSIVMEPLVTLEQSVFSCKAQVTSSWATFVRFIVHRPFKGLLLALKSNLKFLFAVCDFLSEAALTREQTLHVSELQRYRTEAVVKPQTLNRISPRLRWQVFSRHSPQVGILTPNNCIVGIQLLRYYWKF